MPPIPRLRNLEFGSNMAFLGSWRGLKRRGTPIGSIWADFQIKRSQGDLFRIMVLRDQFFLGTAQLLFGTDPFLLGTDELLLGTDQALLGTDQ